MSLELQSNCNLDCSFCPRHLERSGIRKDIEGKKVIRKAPTDKIINIIDQAADLGFQNTIDFHRLSKPFLDERYVEIARHAKMRGLRVNDHSNGHVFKANPGLITKIDGLVEGLTIGLYHYSNYRDQFTA